MSTLNKVTVNKSDDTRSVKEIILDELQSHDRFRLWVNANYTLHVLRNDEEKRVEVKVVELDMQLAQERLTNSIKEILEEKEGKVQIVGAEALKKL